MRHVQVMEDNCNVEAITRLTEEAFGVDPLVLVGVNTLKIEDSESTRSTERHIFNQKFFQNKSKLIFPNFLFISWQFSVMLFPLPLCQING